MIWNASAITLDVVGRTARLRTKAGYEGLKTVAIFCGIGLVVSLILFAASGPDIASAFQTAALEGLGG